MVKGSLIYNSQYLTLNNGNVDGKTTCGVILELLFAQDEASANICSLQKSILLVYNIVYLHERRSITMSCVNYLLIMFHPSYERVSLLTYCDYRPIHK